MSDGKAVLLDKALDTQFERNGFAVVRLLSDQEAAAARSAYGELMGWPGDGSSPGPATQDEHARAATSHLLAELFDSTLTARFDSYAPFRRAVECKYPGDEVDSYPHQSWMHVDERSGDRTFTVWVALDDIETHNGQLQVLRGSHELSDGFRGSGLSSPWLRHEAAIRKRLLTVPLKAGEAVIFDDALVRCSYPNNTHLPRVAAAIGMRPMSVPLAHFYRTGDHTAARCEVDETFFLRVGPGDGREAAQSLPAEEAIELHDHDLDEHELCAALDVDPLARVTVIKRTLLDQRDRAKAAVCSARATVRSSRSTMRDRAGAAGSALAARRSGRRSAASAVGGGATPGLKAETFSLSAAIERFRAEAPTKLAMSVLATNEWIINTFGPRHDAIWDPAEFEWAAKIEAGYPVIRAEVEALLSGPSEIPHIKDVTGGIEQGNIGAWRSFVLMHQWKWMDWNCDRVPRTTELVRDIPGLTLAGFSVLEAGTHITTHRGPNKGALRYQLGVIVPGKDGDCRIRVGDDKLVWRNGEGVMFDFTIPHEAWNDSDATRVLLMLEVLTPLPWYLRGINNVAQHAMGWFPTTRDMRNRLRMLEPELVKS